MATDHKSRLLAALATMRRHRDAADEAERDVTAILLSAIEPSLKPGTVIDKAGRRFGRVVTVNGNDRNARRFEIVGAPSIPEIPSHESLTRVRIDAYPLNESGVRLSGRTARGHYDEHVRIEFQLAIDRGPDDARPCEDMLIEAIEMAERAAEAPPA
jgi:hypothetical protein